MFSQMGDYGGYTSCYMHDHPLNEWKDFGELKTARYHHATSLLNGDLWMTGGSYNRDVKLKLPRFLFQTLIVGSCLYILNYSPFIIETQCNV